MDQDISDAIDSTNSKTFVTFTLPLVLTVAIFVAVYLPTIIWLYHRWMMGVWYQAHGILVPLVSGYLIWKKEKQFFLSEHAVQGSPLGLLFLIPAVLMHILDTVLWTQILSAVSMIPAIIGISFLIFGRSFTLRNWFPLGLLVFMIPVPSAAIQPVILFLRKTTAAGVAFILQSIGVTFVKSGTAFELSNATVNIGDPCSGFATLSATLAFTVTAVYLWPVGFCRSAVLILSAVPVAITANVLRNIILFFLVRKYGAGVLDTFLHPLSGYVMYLIAIALQTWIFVKLKRTREDG